MNVLLYSNEHRKATWLELFFDLIFVVLIGSITHTLGHIENGYIPTDYIIKFILMFMPVWWIWTNYTLYLNLYDDSKTTRLFTLIIMLLIIIFPQLLVYIGLAILANVIIYTAYYLI